MQPVGALSSSVLRALKPRLVSFVGALVLIGVPLRLIAPGLRHLAVLLVVLIGLWIWRLLRRVLATVASRALATGRVPRSRRLYQFLRFSTVDGEVRRACVLSLAACDASDARYQEALAGVAQIETKLEGALLAVSLNLQAYSLARTHTNLVDALRMSEESISLRPQVLGFRHTRGLLLLELGEFDRAARDLDATWQKGPTSDLLESERCFDLGRLWSARGHSDYASDYWERSLRAAPDSRWAEQAAALLGERRHDHSFVADL